MESVARDVDRALIDLPSPGPVGPVGAVVGGVGCRARRAGAGQEHQPELADLHLVATLQRDLVDALAVHIGAVEATDVADGEALGRLAELRMTPRHGDV